mmetsp:Transcript_113166/g.320298  ORF Transcript_113166/g.320298 Transcript_113166/m.320298 type:complete len:202 (-) Transcript_113166:41-646(-)
MRLRTCRCSCGAGRAGNPVRLLGTLRSTQTRVPCSGSSALSFTPPWWMSGSCWRTGSAAKAPRRIWASPIGRLRARALRVPWHHGWQRRGAKAGRRRIVLPWRTVGGQCRGVVCRPFAERRARPCSCGGASSALSKAHSLVAGCSMASACSESLCRATASSRRSTRPRSPSCTRGARAYSECCAKSRVNCWRRMALATLVR